MEQSEITAVFIIGKRSLEEFRFWTGRIFCDVPSRGKLYLKA